MKMFIATDEFLIRGRKEKKIWRVYNGRGVEELILFARLQISDTVRTGTSRVFA
jgi:hypothetical protein